MTTKVTPLGLRLFLEGIESPVISANVSILPDQPASASIQVIPTDMGLHLLPRTLVHLFYLDDEVIEDPSPAPRVGEYGLEHNLNRFDAPDEQYKIMFTGEVVGYNYAKTPSSRQLVLQCLDLSTYWDTCYQWFADYSVGGSGLTDKYHNFVGAGKTLFNSIAGGHQWVIGRILNTKPKTTEYQKAKGLLSGVIHLLEAIGGIRYRSSGQPGFNGVNDFFTIAELRYNLLGMLGALEEDDSSAKMYSNKAFRSWLRNGMTSLGTLLSFRDIINHVNKHIFHHIYPNPCARFQDGGTTTRTVLVQPTTFEEADVGSAIKRTMERAVTTLGKSRNSFKIAATFDLNAFGSARNSLVKGDKLVGEAVELSEILTTDDKIEVNTKLNEAKALTKNALEIVNNVDPGPEGEEITPGVPAIPSENLSAAADQAQEVLQFAISVIQEDILGMKPRARVKGLAAVPVLEGARFFTQLFLPETFFVAPPRCNVIFPDQYFQFSFSRNFMREVSRISMQAGLGLIQGGGRRGAKLLSRSYFAPNIKDVRGNNLFASPARGARILLPHEIHSGIIPKFEWVPDGHRWGLKAAKELDKRNEFDSTDKIAYLQRVANFQFFVHRWSARTMAIGGHFNPRLVLGFPSLVMDRSMPAPEVVKQIESRLGRRWMPVQYLGKTVSISHSINQAGGQTQVQFTHCRTHRGIDDEFVGVLFREVEEIKGKKFTVKFRTRDLLDSNSMTEEEARRIKEEKLAGVITITNKIVVPNREDFRALVKSYVEGKLNPGTLVKGSRKYRGHKVIKVIAGGTLLIGSFEANQFGIDPTTALTRVPIELDLEDPGTFTGASAFAFAQEFETDRFELPEQFVITLSRIVGTGTFKRSDKSIEQAITPGWYSTIWSNDEIGEKVYKPLLDCESIVDNVSLEQSAQNDFLDRTVEESATVQFAELNPEAADRGEESVFSFHEESNIDGSQAQLQVIPGSIEEAIDALTIIYGLIRFREADVHQFIRDYTDRPIANIKEILGSQNLAFDDLGNIDPNLPIDVVEGFHSRAFGDYNVDVKLPDREGAQTQPGSNALKALFPGVPTGKEVKRSAIIDRGQPPSAIKPELDPRGRARARVRAYIEELNVSRGLMG